MKDSILRNKIYILLSTVALLLLWEATAFIVGSSIIIPSPKETLIKLISIFQSPHFITAVINTFKRVVTGFTFSFILALSLGLLSAFIKPIYYLLRPIIIIQKAIPTMAVILLALIWLDSEIAPILVGFLVIFPIIYSSIVQGIKEIDSKLIQMADVYKLSLGTKIRKIYIPSIRSSLISVSSAALGLNLKITIAAEVLSQPNISIGTNFQIEKATLNTAGVFAWALIVILIASIFDIIIKYFEHKYVHN